MVGATRGGLAPAKEGVGKNPERYKLVEPGTIFYNPMRILLGSIALLDEGQPPGITSPDYVVFRTRSGMVHPRWFYYWLRSEDGAAFIRTLARGAVRERMLFRRLVEAEIEVAPYDSQLKFARAIEFVERARAAAEAQLEAAKALPAVYRRAAFTSAEAQRWTRVRLGDLLLEPLRTGISKPARPGADKECLTLSAIRGGFLELSAKKTVGVTDKEANGAWVRAEAFYVVRGNGRLSLVGRGALAPRVMPAPVLYPDLLIQVIPDTQAITLGYLRHVWGSEEVRADVERRARTSAGIFKINQANLAEVRVPLPDREEQEGLATQLDRQLAKSDEVRKSAEERLAAVNNVPAALLRRAFSGDL